MPSFAKLVVYSLAFAATGVLAGPVAPKEGVLSAFHLPANATNGSYQVYFNEDGEEVHVRLPDAPANLAARSPDVSTAPSSHLAKRAPSEMHCGCDRPLNHYNCDNAVQLLKNQLGPTGAIIPHGNAFYSIWGDVVAFVCTANSGAAASVDHRVSADTYASEIGWVTNACGWYISGTYEFRSWGAYASYLEWNAGYMQYSAGLDFCRYATGSNLGSC